MNKPRILCLHGGGVSARIFKLQFRYFLTYLEPHFRLVFADGPWSSEMHTDLISVYEGMGPCYRWARWQKHQPQSKEDEAIAAVEKSLTKAMAADEGFGDWVGLIGFSQGAKLAFSILLENQLRRRRNPSASGFAGAQWQFGIIMAAQAPPYSLSRRTRHNEHYVSLNSSRRFDRRYAIREFPDKLRTPTLHVHALQDAGLPLHRELMDMYCGEGSASLIEWDGDHRIPYRTPEIKSVVNGLLDISRVSASFRLI